MTDHTTNAPQVDLRPQARLLTRLVAGVTDEQLAARTPCPQMAARNLLGHLARLSVAFRAAARKDFGPSTDTPPAAAPPDVPQDWRETLPRLFVELADAWLDPAAWTGQTRAGGLDLPGAVAGLVAADELVVHGWDLARATGQPYAPDEAALQAAHALLAPAAEDPDRAGFFGTVVPVPDDAPLLDRVIGLSGRDPRWAPPDAA